MHTGRFCPGDLHPAQPGRAFCPLQPPRRPRSVRRGACPKSGARYASPTCSWPAAGPPHLDGPCSPMMDTIHPRRPYPQPGRIRPRPAARPADRDHRPVRLGQVAGLRHHLRRGPAPLRRIAVGLRPPVPELMESRTSTTSRACRRRFPSNRNRPRWQPALDRRHHHRDLRLPAPAVRRVGTRAARITGFPLEAQTVSQMVDTVLALPRSENADQRWMLLAPVVHERKGEHAPVRTAAARAGVRPRARGRANLHEIDAPCRRWRCARSTPSRRWSTAGSSPMTWRQRLAESFETGSSWRARRR